ncbi:MAG TPA: hypothetical protein VGH38_36690 [Bryobacteraceae bacterium]|jgi:hypothetical protein
MRLSAILALLLAVTAHGQVDPLCGQIQAVTRAAEMAKITVDPDLRAAGTACASPGDTAAVRQRLEPLHLTPQRIFAWMDQFATGLTGHDRFEVLPGLAKAALRAGNLDVAQAYARELLQEAPQHIKDPIYGDAIYDGYSVLGRVALRHDNLPLANRYLMNAATTPGSAALSRAGPDMTLVKELLERRQTSNVLEFFVRCREFWKSDNGRLAAWSDSVRNHKMPEFGANLEN